MTELLLVLVYFSIILLTINYLPYFKIVGISRTWIYSAFLIKIAASGLLYYIYTFYYTDRQTADIFKYFDDSRVIYQIFFTHPSDFFRIMTGIGNDTPHFSQYYQQMNNWYGIYPSNVYGDGHIMIRFNALLRFISMGYYPVHALVMCLLSFTGLIALFKVFSRNQSDHRKLLFLLLFSFPSIILWTSGVLKEGLVFFSLGISLYFTDLMIHTKFKIHNFLFLILALIILRYTRFYLFIFLLPLLIAYVWSSKKNGSKAFKRYLVVISMTLMMGIIAGLLMPEYNIIHIIAKKQQDFLALARLVNAGSIIISSPLKSSWLGITLELIPGFFRSLLVPYPWDIRNIMMIIPALENIFLIGFILVCLTGFRSRMTNPSLFWLSIYYFLMVYTITGCITPVAGALARYKVIAIPFLLYSLITIWNIEKSIHYLLKK